MTGQEEQHMNQPTRISCVNLAITDRCNRNCSECCCDVLGIAEHWDISMAGINRAAKALYGIERLTLTGGEPTHYPLLLDVLPKLKSLFGCNSLEIETNGSVPKNVLSKLNLFDVVAVTRYGPPEFESNEKEIKAVEMAVDPSRLRIDPSTAVHVPRSHRGNRACVRGAGITVAVYRDRVYPCCMGWGIHTSQSVPLSETWEKDVMALPRPCKDCFFAEQ